MGDQEPLFGAVASNATAFRVIDRIAADPGLLEALRAARARARENAWDAEAAPKRILIDIDATLITAQSEKEGAAGTFKGDFGFHPLLAYLDESHEPLAGVLRPGNAGANTAADHIEVVDLARGWSSLRARRRARGLRTQELRYRLLHTAARLAFHARRATLRLQRTWPWARELAAAFARLVALPSPAR